MMTFGVIFQLRWELAVQATERLADIPERILVSHVQGSDEGSSRGLVSD